MDAFRIGTNERMRFALAALRARFTTGADGGLLWLRHQMEDLGFSDVVPYVDRAKLPGDWPMREERAVLEFPEWEAWAEATWKGEGAIIKEDWTELRVLRRHAAPPVGTKPAPPPPPLPPAPGPTETHPMTPWEGPVRANAIPFEKRSVIPLLLQPVLIAGGFAAGVTLLSWVAKRTAKPR